MPGSERHWNGPAAARDYSATGPDRQRKLLRTLVLGPLVPIGHAAIDP